MVPRLIGRGLLAGALGGLLAFVFARIFAEPQVQAAIDYEGGRSAAQEALDRLAGHEPGPAEAEVFSRTVQADIGIGVGMILFGVAMGALLAVAFVYCVGRTGALRPRTLALLVAGGGFVGLYLVPFLKYPANPPAVGHDDTIGERGAWYLAAVLASVVILGLAVWLGQRLRPRFGTWNSSLLAGGAYLVAVGVLILLLPSTGQLGDNVALYGDRATETPLPLTDPNGTIVFPGFPADLLWSFRLYSVAAQLILWTAIGLVFAPTAERVLGRGADAPARVAA
jgi:hypothetical protein